MSEQEAAEAASRAKGEAKAAAKDTARAVKAGAEVAAEELKDEADKAEETVKDAVRAAKGMDIPGFLLDCSIGLGSTSLSLVFGIAAFRAFKNAPQNLKR